MSPTKPNKPTFPSSPQEWLAHARSDLRLAELGNKSEEILDSQVCFHAQQCAEKSLKALLVHFKLEFPLTHDLEELLRILSNSKLTIPSHIAMVGLLIPFAVETRYPGAWEEIQEEEVEQALTLARQILEWAQQVTRTQKPS